MTAATQLARYGATWKGALREQLRYRPKLHHHLGHDLLESLWSGGSGGLSIADDGTRIDEGASPPRVVRDYRALAQIALTRGPGVKPSHISAIETGRRAGTTQTLIALARALGAPLGVLAGE